MKYRLAIVMIIIAALMRLVPHPMNFTPLGAMGLFGAAYLGGRGLSILIPFLGLFLSDLILNNVIYADHYQGVFQWYTSLWIYGAFAVVVGIGYLFFRQGVTIKRVLGASLTASVAFFLISNFWSWISYGTYPPTPAGLFACYVAGIPFFGNTIMGDLFYSGVMFGAFAWIAERKLALA